MFEKLKRAFAKPTDASPATAPDAPAPPAPRMPEGETGIRLMGHREYVGGMWEHIGRLQFDYLVSQGLRPEHVLVDIACGSLRGGVHFIRYLNPGNYLGMDKEQQLIDLGIEKELTREVYEQKRPEFVVSGSFEFHRFQKRPQYALAQSLFTHLSSEDIKLCLRNLRAVAEPSARFFATFFEGTPDVQPVASHSHVDFVYSRAEMERMGETTGWTPRYIGPWNHPRGQMIMRYEAV